MILHNDRIAAAATDADMARARQAHAFLIMREATPADRGARRNEWSVALREASKAEARLARIAAEEVDKAAARVEASEAGSEAEREARRVYRVTVMDAEEVTT